MAASRIRALYPVQRQFTMVAMAMWLGRVSFVHRIRSMPKLERMLLMSPYCSPNMFEKIMATATGVTM